MKTIKITLIYPFAYGYIDFVVKELKSYPNTVVSEIKTDLIKYQYPNKFVKLKNGITKLFGKNIKKEYFRNEVLKNLDEHQDIVFIIRPDQLDNSLLNQIKKRTGKLIAFYYDSCKKYPRQVDILHFFDEVFSYEKIDIDTYGFTEANNFIYDTEILEEPIKYDIFNISSYDSRIDEIDQTSQELVRFGFNIHFILFWFQKLSYPNLICVTEYLTLQQTKKLIAQSKAIMDIQRKDQEGLSFRTFESLGYQKKLITTNKKVLNYDFYHPNNILFVETDKLNHDEIENFLSLPYQELSQEMIEKYSVQKFVKNVFKI